MYVVDVVTEDWLLFISREGLASGEVVVFFFLSS